MIILGIESSCDDTSVAVVEGGKDFVVLAERTASQIEVHKKYGGVVPEVAGRQHAENILPVLEEVFRHKNIKTLKHKNKPFVPDVIAVTAGPGLVTGLVVGVEAAKTLSYLWDVPLVAVNHIAGHAHSVQVRSKRYEVRNVIEYPALALIVSGGHTELLLMTDPTTFTLIGKTHDDAAGECFDKVGKLLGFDYPGGPRISKFAAEGDPKAIAFPRPMLDKDNYDFSFAGLKTAALYWLRDHESRNTYHVTRNNPNNPQPKTYHPSAGSGQALKPKTLKDFCASFESAIIETLVTKTIRAAEQYQPKTIILGGGVAANQKLRESLKAAVADRVPGSSLPAGKAGFQVPGLKYAMDNAAMIAVAGYYLAQEGQYTHWKDIQVNPNWRVYGHDSLPSS